MKGESPGSASRPTSPAAPPAEPRVAAWLRRLSGSTAAPAVVLGAAVALAVLGLRAAGTLQPLELAFYDWMILTRPAAPPAPPRVALVTVTEDDIQRLGRYPVPNGTLARALATLLSHGPRAVGVDLYLDIPVPPGREALDAVLAAHDNVIAVMKFKRGGETGVGPPALLEGSDRIGFTDVVVDPGGTVRRGLLYLDDGVTVSTSLALRLAETYLRGEGVVPAPDPSHPQQLRLGRRTIPPLEAGDGGYADADARGYQFLIDYREPPGAFPAVTLSELLAGAADAALFSDRLVLIGVVAPSVKDVFSTPFSREPGATPPMWGVDLHAHVADQLLRLALDGARPLRPARSPWKELWLLLWSLLGVALALAVRSPWRFAPAAAGGVLLIGAGTWALFQADWWLPAVPAGLAWILSAGLVTAQVSWREQRERRELMGLFASHVSPQVARAIWAQRAQFAHGGRPVPQRLVATVLFTDVHHFTTISESMDPQRCMAWLNEYMETLTPTVIAHGGVILRFIGDAIMAVFGAPLARGTEEQIARDAVAAVDCALAMNEALIALNRRLSERGLPMIGMRAGILTGPMVAGTIGTAQRLEYVVHGDTVNTAARIEGFDKQRFTPDYVHAPCRVLAGGATVRYLGERYHTEWVAEARLRGKHERIALYRVLGRRPDSAPAAAS